MAGKEYRSERQLQVAGIYLAGGSITEAIPLLILTTGATQSINVYLNKDSMTQNTISSLDLELDFILHLAMKESVEYILKEGVSSELLLTPRAKSVYQFVRHHFSESGKLPSLVVLNTEFPSVEFEKPESSVEYLVDRLRHRYQKNKVSDLTVALSKKIETPDDAMHYLRDQVLEIEKASLSQRHIWTPDDYEIFIHDLQQKVLGGHFKGVGIGYPEIDKFTGGIKDGWAVYILARPKRTKTFQMLMAFIAMAMEGKEPYLNVLEGTANEALLRLTCMISGFPWEDAMRGNFMPQDWKLIKNTWKSFSSKYKCYVETPPLDERTVPQMMLKADKVGAGALLFSQFRYINGTKDWYRQEHEEAAEIALDLKRAATRPGNEKPFLIEAQFNRGGDSMAELEDFDAGKVGLTDMIPQSADSLLGLFQSKDMRANKSVEYGILESRHYAKAAWYIETEFKARTEFKLIQGSQH